VTVRCDAQLPQVVVADGGSTRFTSLLNCRQQQREHAGQDGQHDEQFYEGYAVAATYGRRTIS
jgi:hypothetical protein